jgi:hypothetical protein
MKGNIYKNPHIDPHGREKNLQGEKNHQGKLPFSIDVKGGEKAQKNERKGEKWS